MFYFYKMRTFRRIRELNADDVAFHIERVETICFVWNVFVRYYSKSDITFLKAKEQGKAVVSRGGTLI